MFYVISIFALIWYGMIRIYWSTDSNQHLIFFKAASEFWENRAMWLNSWNLAGSNDAALQVDYVRVYAL